MTPASPHQDPLPSGERLTLDAPSRATDRLRGVAGLLAAGAVGVILLVGGLGDPRLVLCSGVGALFAIGWMARGARRRDPTAWLLELSPERLRLQQGPRGRTVDWARVRAVEVDEERLAVRVVVDPLPKDRPRAGPAASSSPPPPAADGGRDDGDPRDLVIPPEYGGLGVYELAGRLEAYWKRSPAPAADVD